MSRDLEVTKADFIEWRRLPPAARKPKTITGWAEEHDVARKTLHAWLNEPDVKRAIVSTGRHLFTADEIKRARDTLVAEAHGGSVFARNAEGGGAEFGIKLALAADLTHVSRVRASA